MIWLRTHEEMNEGKVSPALVTRATNALKSKLAASGLAVFEEMEADQHSEGAHLLRAQH